MTDNGLGSSIERFVEKTAERLKPGLPCQVLVYSGANDLEVDFSNTVHKLVAHWTPGVNVKIGLPKKG